MRATSRIAASGLRPSHSPKVASLSSTTSPSSPSRSAMTLTFCTMRSRSGYRSISSPEQAALFGGGELLAHPGEFILAHGEERFGGERLAGAAAGAGQRARSGLAALDRRDLVGGGRLLGAIGLGFRFGIGLRVG